jgi:hypothetical protein
VGYSLVVLVVLVGILECMRRATSSLEEGAGRNLSASLEAGVCSCFSLQRGGGAAQPAADSTRLIKHMYNPPTY